MPFSLKNAPTMFMRLMDDVLRTVTNSFVVVYLDDILMFKRTWEENMCHIQQVLSTLRQHKLYENLEKCSFSMNMVQYLYSWFMLGFSHIAWYISEVSKGGDKDKFVWGKEQQQAFDDLKHRLCSTPTLSFPDFQQPFEIETDASNYGMGTFITHHGHLVACHSETISDTV
jgi:hypothetical protein